MNVIYKVIVGSQAHGLATPESDFDRRGIFLAKTSDILKLESDVRQTHWVEGDEDNTMWELGHFLKLATKCNPTILETFCSPLSCDTYTKYVGAIQDLFPYVWNSTGVKNAFMGYSHNQQKKFFDKDCTANRRSKFAVAYLRVLYQGVCLLEENRLPINLENECIFEQIRAWKNGKWAYGEVVDTCMGWRDRLERAYKANPDKKADLEKVNDFLLMVRKDNW